MTFDEYQKDAKRTAKYPSIQESWVYPTLGLVSEAGEVAGKVKKVFRDHGGKLTDAQREDLQKEVGDVLWYVAAVCTELGFSLDETAQKNLDKLTSRMDRGTIGGNGDNR